MFSSCCISSSHLASVPSPSPWSQHLHSLRPAPPSPNASLSTSHSASVSVNPKIRIKSSTDNAGRQRPRLQSQRRSGHRVSAWLRGVSINPLISYLSRWLTSVWSLGGDIGQCYDAPLGVNWQRLETDIGGGRKCPTKLRVTILHNLTIYSPRPTNLLRRRLPGCCFRAPVRQLLCRSLKLRGWVVVRICLFNSVLLLCWHAT